MGDTKLCLLLLLCTYAFAQEDIGIAEEESAPCLLAKRFKSLRNYVYQYETEALNGVSGTSNLRNGAKATCKVEIDVPQTCSYIVRTTECTLSEVSDIDPEGLPVYGPAAGADAFQAAMAKHPLKLTVEGESKVSLFPEEDEPITILNIKRGIISALLVPVLEEESNKNMATLHGMCQTDFAVNSREDIATDVTITRRLSHCNGFSPKKDFASPLALISGLHIPLSKLISSTQTCNYKFDNEKKYMTEGTCTEKHILLPFSHQKQHGVLTLIKQTLALQETSKINDRVFDHNEANLKSLMMEAVEDKSPAQTKDGILATLRELSTLSQTNQGKQRAHLFQKLVTEIRGLKGETLSPAVPEMLELSGPLTWQALAQCGTPECSSAILQILRTMDKTAVEVDAAVYAVGLLPNPTNHLVQDMLSIAQYKPSKPILYGLSNIVSRVHKIEGKVTPEITAVSEYIASLLGDCSGDEDQTFLALRVIGNMGRAMEAANPALKSALLQCMTQPATTPTVQQTAIQAFRKLTITEEARGVLLQTVLDGASPIQKRVAAYLVLMKNPEPSDLAQVIRALPNEEDPQAKSFVASHLANILSSTDPASQQMKEKIKEALQGHEVPAALEFSKFSRNYKMSNNVEGNVIFDSTGYLPKEIMLETTLKAFGYDLDVLEVGLDGKGLEPTFEALFGQDGFFPDTLSKALYWAGGKMPASVNTLLRKMIPAQNERMKRQVPENILREISHNVNKLVRELKTQSPDALIYLKLLGSELGFIKTAEMEQMAYSVGLLADNLLKMFPTDIIKLISSIDNELFIHYIFMDNEFSLPTASGIPLKVSLSGTIAPGAKGGLHLTPGLQEISFMPSIGAEIVTMMGVQISEFFTSGVSMNTNVYHESALNAKVAISNNQIKLTVPAPQSTTRLFEISNKLLSVTTTESKALPPITEDRTDLVKCIPVLPGMKSCITLKYPGSTDAAPYFPLTGETEVAVELEPTGQVTEYTATVAYELITEGEAPEKVDALKIALTAEGAEPLEGTAIFKYNRNTNVLTTDVQIPDCDIEAGVRLSIKDDNTNGKGIMVDITHKSIPQISLIGRAKLEAMRNGMLQFQLAIPSLKSHATVTAALKRAEDLTLDIESIINIPEISSLQKGFIRYDENQIEVELKSDLKSEVHQLLHNIDEYQKIIQDHLDQTVIQTDITVRHIVSKFIEAANIWLDRAVADAPVPILESLKQIRESYLPEELFLKSENAFRYKFNQKYITIPVAVPLGGKSSEDLNIPHTLTTLQLAMPQLGLVIPSTEVSIPTFSIPSTYELSVPLVEMEVSTKVNSNFYNWEGLASIDAPAKMAKYKVVGDCPMEILSYKIEGTGALTTTSEESSKAIVNSYLSHKLIDARVSLEGVGSITDKVHILTNCKIEASSPLGLETSLHYTTQSTLASDELAGDGNLDGTIKIGSLYANTTCSQSYMVYPSHREMRGESTLRVDSTVFQADNRIKGTFANDELSIMSSTNLYNDILKHVAEVSFKEARLSVKSDGISTVLGGTLRNQIELAASVDSASIRVESHVDRTSNRAFSLLSGFLSTSNLELNTEGSLILGASRGSHKATLTYRNQKLATSGTTTLQSSPLIFENVFSGGIDKAGTTLSIISKGSMLEMKIENKNTLALTFSTLSIRAQTDSIFSDSTSYKHDMTVDIKPFLAAIKCSTTGKIMGAHLIQNTDLDVAGLSSKFNNEIRFNSQAFHLDSTLRTLAAPFSLSVDSIFNSDGEVTWFGKHTGQLYGKLLLKAEPLAVAFTHDCRASTIHQLDSETYVETHFENNIDSLLTPELQRGTWRMKSKLNNHAYNQEVNIYNQPERLGVELSGIVLTDLLNKPTNVNQEYSISSFLKYDKNSDSHALMLPFTENLPAIFEHLKMSSVHVLESLKLYINREEIQTMLENLPHAVSDFFRGQDLENKFTEVKEKIVTLLHEYAVLPENVEAFLESIKIAIETIMNNVGIRLKGIIAVIKETIENGVWSDALEAVLSGLKATDDKYEIRATIASIITNAEHIMRQVDLEKLKDSSLAWLQELNVKYDLRAKLQEKVSELKQAVESFDLAVCFQDLKNFVSSLNLGGYIEQLVSEIPREAIIKLVDLIKHVISTCIQELKITDQVDAVYTKVRDIIVDSEVDKKIEILLEEVLNLIKRLKIEDTVQAVVNAVKPIDLPTLYVKGMQLLDYAVNHLNTLDFKQIIDLLNKYIDVIVKTLKSFDYNAFVDEVNQNIGEITSFVNEQIQTFEIRQKIEAVREFVTWIQTSLLDFALPENSLPEINFPDIVIPKLNLENFDIKTLSIPEFTLPSIPSELIVPAFGKLHGEFRLKSPHYNVRTSAELQNSTTNPMTPQLTAYLTSQATSPADIFNYVLDITARVSIPKLSRIILAETIKFTHSAASLEQQGSVTIYGLSAQASSKIAAKATTAIYSAKLVNSAFFALENGFSGSVDTTYSQNLNLEFVRISSEANMTQNVVGSLEAGTIRVTHGTSGNGRWTFWDYTDELTHKSVLDFTVGINSAKLTFTANTNGESLTMNQTLNADGNLFRHITLKGSAETDTPFIKNSLAVVNGNVDMRDLKIDLKASHDAELIGKVSGTISNTINLLANPFDIIFDLQNKGNAKADLPLSLSGKIDLQNDYAMTLNAEVQQINWVALSRFNQHKYFHNLTLENNKKEIAVFAKVNGEANLNILTFPVDIPGVAVPFIDVQTPSLYEVSLWENTGLKTFLTTTEQTIDINLYLQYEKNPAMISLGINPITIPTLGNLIFDLSMKSPVFSLNANAGLQNHEEIIARFEVNSTSLFDILKGKFDGTTSLSRKKRGIKLATALSLEHSNVQGTHDITISINRRAMDASVATVAKVTLPILNLEFNHEILGSTKAKASMDSKIKLKYSFNLPLIDAIGKGDIEQNLALEGFSDHIYLNTSNKGKINGIILASGNFSGALNNEAHIHLDVNGLRSAMKTHADSNGNFGDSTIWSMDLNEDLALDASPNGVDVGLNLIYNNEVNMQSINTKGKYVAKGIFELGPFAQLRANLDIDMSQPSSLGEASILQNTALEITPGKQKLSLKGREQLVSVLHTYNLLLSNDQPEIQMEVSASIDCHADVLKAITLPIYQKNLWDVLKFDQATSEEYLQSVKGTIVAVCSKNQDKYIPAALFTNVKISSPIYNTTLTANLENNAPAYIASLKSSCTSTLDFLAYDIDATVIASTENGALSLNNKGTFSHSDLKMDLQHVFSHILRQKQQDSADASSSRHILNVDITSPTFSDMSFRYASGKDSISTTISAPTAGFLGLQLSQSSARLYARYPSEPEKDVPILIFKKAQTILNKDAFNDILLGLHERVPAITVTLYNTVDKYHSTLFDRDISSASHDLKNTLSTTFEKAYIIATDSPEMSEFPILFRNLIHQYQNNMKIVVDAVIKFLRELQLQLPGFEEQLSLPELCHKIMSSVATVIDNVVQRLNDYLEPYVEAIIAYYSNIKVSMPGINEVPASQVLENLKSTIKKIVSEIVGMVRHLESPDVVLQKLADLVQDCAKKSEELIGSIKSETLDAVVSHINTNLAEVLKMVQTTFEKVYAYVTLEQLNDSLQYLIETIRIPLGKINTSTDIAVPAPEDVLTPENVQAPEEVPDVEAPVAEEEPAAPELPAAEELPTVEEEPTAEEVPAAEDMPAAEDVPAAEVVADMGEMSASHEP